MSDVFEFDKDYKNKEQVRPFLVEFNAVHDEITAAGGYPYNDKFRGRITGIVGPDEDAAIYLLQTLRDLDDLAGKVAAFGGEEVTELDDVRRGDVAMYGYYMGGTGWRVYRDVRLVPRNGRPHTVLPKGARTQGYPCEGRILFKANQ